MRICMLAYTFYENDNRVRRYAEALAARGDHVDIVALKNGDLPDRDILRGVNIYRIQKRFYNEKHKLQYLFRTMLFLVRSGLFVTKRSFRKPYDLIHIHSVPDFEVFSALMPKLMGTKIILDIHDIVPEFYASKFGVSKTSLIFRLLVLIEKVSIAFSDHAIAANHIWEKRLLSRSVKPEKCSVYLNYPDSALFYPRKVTKDPDKLIFVYPGSLNWHQGLDIAIRAFSRIKGELKSAEFHIYGDGPERNNLEQLIRELGVEHLVLLKDSIPMDQVGDVMAKADIGVVPKRNDSFGGEAFSTKIFEFMSLGVPIIVSATTIDKYYFNDSVVHFFEPENEGDLAQTMLLLGKDKKQRDMKSDRALEFVNQYSWGKNKQEYFDLVDKLVNTHPTSKDQKDAFNRCLLNTYYFIKPMVPRRLQLRLRRSIALNKKAINRDIWPINQKIGEKPAGWPGWPENKRFAFVLTHDVEGKEGISKCLQLAKIDEKFGFRSSFNFVAKDYQIPPDLLEHLRNNGHEIGVHGLTHRGNLFRSRRTFEKQSGTINEYLKKWGAVGFRCPSMFHHFEWIHDLDILYDASTFDTDPFEPQSDGVGTIFPFNVKKKDASNSYVELPYTLPQDHLLYVIMEEKTNSIWQTKLDWIAEKGGMVLLNVHPDYVHFNKGKNPIDTYPVNLYISFLEYVSNRYKGQYWHAFPREVAAFVKKTNNVI